MNDLDMEQQQSALLQQLFARSTAATTADRGLQAYRSHAAATARTALTAAYPVTRQLLGKDSFDQLAPVLWRTHPPQRGDLAQWGGTLADFLQSYDTLMADNPFLPDVARLEWQLHRTATLPDRQMDADSFALLESHTFDTIHLIPAPGACLLHSRFPAASIVLAHQMPATEKKTETAAPDTDTQQPNLTAAQEKLRQGAGETALVWRQGFRPVLREAQAEETVFLQAVLAGWSLQNALHMVEHLDAVPGSQPVTFDFSHWLPLAITEKLILGCRTTG